MSEIPVYCALLVSCPLGLAALWLWGPGRLWWQSLPSVDRFRWILYVQLTLAASAIIMALVWWPAALMSMMMLIAARVTERELRLEVKSATLSRMLTELESSGEMPPEVAQSLRRALESVHGIGT